MSERIGQIDTDDEVAIKRGKGRPRVPYRAILEKGKYDTKSKDPEYFKKYYLEKVKDVKIPCPVCGACMWKTNITRHMNSSRCKPNV